MKLIGSWSAKLALTLLVAVALISMLQARATEHGRFGNPVHMSSDWSSRHLRYSGTGTAEQSWRMFGDPRFHRHMLTLARNGRFNHRTWPNSFHVPLHPFLRNRLSRDWQMPFDVNSTTGDWQHNGGYYASPAKFTFDINATPDCVNDYVTFPTNQVGATGTLPSIVGLNQLYSGSGAGGNGICGLGQPAVLFAYNTNLSGDATGKVMSSPAVSLDGKRIVYVETGVAGGAQLKILQWNAGEGAIAGTGTSTSVAPTQLMTTGQNWSACTVGNSCLFTLTFTGGAQDTGSSPFVDYLNDALYVGDDAGSLHKFTGVFTGTPTEATTGWPISVSTGKLTGPVFDEVSGNIYMADNITPSASSLFYVRDTASTVGTCASGTPPCKGGTSLAVTNGSQGVFDPPIVDPVKQTVYVFVGLDAGGNAAVIQTTTALGVPVTTELGTGGAAAGGYGGAFDSNYIAGNYASGHLYVCGTTPTTLFRIGFDSSGVMNSTVDAGSFQIQSGAVTSVNCSPFTEIVNGTSDFIFFGIPSNVQGGLGNGAIVGLDVANSPWPPTILNFAALAETVGSSGIVVDNVGTGGQESSIYFTPQSGVVTCNGNANVGCMVKATQAGLN